MCVSFTFILKCNETPSKGDPLVIILYDTLYDSFQKVILAVGKYQYQKMGGELNPGVDLRHQGREVLDLFWSFVCRNLPDSDIA